MILLFAHPDYEHELVGECRARGVEARRIAKLLYAVDLTARESAKHKASFVWARDEWRDVEVLEVESVAKAVAALKERSKQAWIHVTTTAHRRGDLIESQFLSKAKRLKLRAKMNAWPNDDEHLKVRPAFTLLSPTEIAICVSPREAHAGGAWEFAEDREGPPSRAYLKLWEWGWRTSIRPKAGETALDLGASPGGWTWVLAQAGLHVYAYDRSPLKLDLPKAVLQRIHFEKGDAFNITPENAPKTDWVFCDVIAEPKRTVQLIEAWLPTKAGLVFTIKFKGETDLSALERLAAVPDGVIRHLDVNKHEVTFWRLPVST